MDDRRRKTVHAARRPEGIVKLTKITSIAPQDTGP